MRPLVALCAFGLCLLAGCAAQRGPAIELQPDTGFELEYSGGIGSGVEVPAVTEFDSPKGGEQLVELETRVIRLTCAQAAQLVTNPGAVGASGLAADKADALVKEATRLGGVLVSAPKVVAFVGQAATISITNQVSYISGFELKGDAKTRIADPVVSVLTDGLLLALRASETKTGTELELEMVMSELVRPIPTVEVKVFGAPMTIQTPTTLTQKIKGRGPVSEQQVLVLTGLVGQGNDVLLVLVRTSKHKQ